MKVSVEGSEINSMVWISKQWNLSTFLWYQRTGTENSPVTLANSTNSKSEGETKQSAPTLSQKPAFVHFLTNQCWQTHWRFYQTSYHLIKEASTLMVNQIKASILENRAGPSDWMGQTLLNWVCFCIDLCVYVITDNSKDIPLLWLFDILWTRLCLVLPYCVIVGGHLNEPPFLFCDPVHKAASNSVPALLSSV